MSLAMPVESESRLAENILLFCRTLRQAGLPIGPGQVLDSSMAVLQAGIARREDFYFALRAVLVTDPVQFRLFDQAFHIYFRNPRLLERLLGLLLPTLEKKTHGNAGEVAVRRLLEALTDDGGTMNDDIVIDVDQFGSYSNREVIRHKDFAQMSLEEQQAARQMLCAGARFLRDVPTRRFQAHGSGDRYDMRRTMRLMLRNNGQLLELARKKRRRRPPTLVLLCDISGSMSRYSRMFLHFAHALGGRSRTVHSFVFGTELTNITHRLQHRDVDVALRQVAADVRDWDGGTRIADCLKRFNVDWGRRLLAGRAVVVLLSDGLERDTEANLEFQMQRLQASCDELIWLNPLLRYDEFEPRAGGISAMLPHVDRFLPAHNVAGILNLSELLRQGKPGRQGLAA
jgi:uncharacterized protein with von Willebrand factor type A (vWA) domain